MRNAIFGMLLSVAALCGSASAADLDAGSFNLISVPAKIDRVIDQLEDIKADVEKATKQESKAPVASSPVPHNCPCGPACKCLNCGCNLAPAFPAQAAPVARSYQPPVQRHYVEQYRPVPQFVQPQQYRPTPQFYAPQMYRSPCQGGKCYRGGCSGGRCGK